MTRWQMFKERVCGNSHGFIRPQYINLPLARCATRYV